MNSSYMFYNDSDTYHFRFFEVKKKSLAFLAFCLEHKTADIPHLLLEGNLRDTGSANEQAKITVGAYSFRRGDSCAPLLVERVATSTYRELPTLNCRAF